MLEKSIESAFKGMLEQHGFKVLKLTTPAHSGTPDRIILWPTYHPNPPIFVEFKQAGKKERPLQIAVRENWTARGCDVRKAVCGIREAHALADSLTREIGVKL